MMLRINTDHQGSPWPHKKDGYMNKLTKRQAGHYASHDWSVRKCPEYGNWDVSRKERWGSSDDYTVTLVHCADTLREAKAWISAQG